MMRQVKFFVKVLLLGLAITFFYHSPHWMESKADHLLSQLNEQDYPKDEKVVSKLLFAFNTAQKTIKRQQECEPRVKNYELVKICPTSAAISGKDCKLDSHSIRLSLKSGGMEAQLAGADTLKRQLQLLVIDMKKLNGELKQINEL